MYSLEKVAEATWNFFNGRIGKYTYIRQPYRRYWKIFWFLFNLWLFVKVILFSLFGWWDGVVCFLNGVIWG